MNFIKSFDSTNLLMIAIGSVYLFDTFTEDVPNFGILFWVTFGVVLKGIGAFVIILGAILSEVNNQKTIDKNLKHEKKKFYFWVVLFGLIVGFIGVILKIRGM